MQAGGPHFQVFKTTMYFSKTETCLFRHTAEIAAQYSRKNDRTGVPNVFISEKQHTTKETYNLDSFFPEGVFGWGLDEVTCGPKSHNTYGPNG